ncbi:hypothetical protein PISL3812_06321 [Talaromyces islandicus]|uniref:N-acetyltransferase domain-containing protein n=1 Tax=Talaromyces islandicus TaxID=28573 RepID=A0A0U1M119_TALIS|nr:hypothetical protein PISL3812_06321 [Talaromyces islandicus]
MISAEHAKVFTHDWSITIPERPSVRYIHTPLSRLDEWLGMLTNPANRPHDATLRSKEWDQAAMEELRATTIKKHHRALTEFDGLSMMVLVDGQLVGGGNYSLLPTGEVNLGMMFEESARGKGLGKLTMQVLIKLGQRLGIKRLEAGTMKSNQAMQALMARLNIPGRDEIKEAPGRGVVAEILYDIPETVEWEIDLQLEFGGPMAENGEGEAVYPPVLGPSWNGNVIVSTLLSGLGGQKCPDVAPAVGVLCVHATQQDQKTCLSIGGAALLSQPYRRRAPRRLPRSLSFIVLV